MVCRYSGRQTTLSSKGREASGKLTSCATTTNRRSCPAPPLSNARGPPASCWGPSLCLFYTATGVVERPGKQVSVTASVQVRRPCFRGSTSVLHQSARLGEHKTVIADCHTVPIVQLFILVSAVFTVPFADQLVGVFLLVKCSVLSVLAHSFWPAFHLLYTPMPRCQLRGCHPILVNAPLIDELGSVPRGGPK